MKRFHSKVINIHLIKNRGIKSIRCIFTVMVIVGFMVACQSNPSGSSFPNQYPSTSPISATQAKFALVIGNRDYEYTPLTNTIHDATDVADVLKEIGFDEVLLKTNLNKRGMDEALAQFTQRLSTRPGSLGLFYFSGHGARVEGQNYLIPVDNYKIKKENDLQYEALDSQKVLEDMQWAKTALNILILDACRDNPYENNVKSLNRGLAKMPLQNSTIIAFSTAPGKTASDKSRNGRNGLYSSHLIPLLKKAKREGMRVDDMFMNLSNAVLEESYGEQEPWHNVSWRQPFCFGKCQAERELEREEREYQERLERERQERERQARLERERQERLERERLERERQERLERERLERERQARLERERLERESQCSYCNCEEIIRKFGLGIEPLTPQEEAFRQTHCHRQ